MNDFEKMTISAQKAMIHVLKLDKEDDVLIITDKHTKREGEAFYTAAIEYGSTAYLYFLPENNRPLLEIPPNYAPYLKEKL